MLSSKKLLSAMVGVAMLALPTTALAGHHDDGFHPYGWHDRGWHNGWFKHHDRDDFRPYYRDGFRPYWRHGDWDDAHPNWRRNAFRCDADGDDCHRVGSGYWNGYNGYSYAPPASYYGATPPSYYNPSQQMNWLLGRRQAATIELQRLRAQHDSRGAARMVTQIQSLNGRINSLNRGGYGYVPPITSGVAVPYTGEYNPYYGNNPYSSYYGNATTNLLGALAGPALGVR